jgi:hypothetical protein
MLLPFTWSGDFVKRWCSSHIKMLTDWQCSYYIVTQFPLINKVLGTLASNIKDSLKRVPLLLPFTSFFYCFIIRMCIQRLESFLPLAPTPSFTTHATPYLSSHPLNTRQKLFCPYCYFCWRENISNNKKEQVILLVEIRTAKQGVDSH